MNDTRHCCPSFDLTIVKFVISSLVVEVVHFERVRVEKGDGLLDHIKS
jgi:hypothetical protein